MRAKKKVFFRIHIDMYFLQKTEFKMVKFGPCGPIYILQTPIGGSHPVPCLSTQIAERQGTAMYYTRPEFGRQESLGHLGHIYQW